jgi:hypothetical protein
MLDPENQEWLDKLYSKILSSNINNGGYYDNTLKLLSMITISGNYWVPDCDILNGMGDLQAPSKMHFNIWPSPANDWVHISLEETQTNLTFQTTIADLSGKMVWQSHLVSDKEISLDVSGFENGLYLVSFTNSKSQQLIGMKKLIISK